MDYKKLLGKMLREKSLAFYPEGQEVTLSSGAKSNYYFDCKLTTLDPEGAFLTGHSVLETLNRMALRPDAIGGMSMGADPIVSAAVVVSYLEKKPLPGFLIRDERKKHGRKRQIEGFERPPHTVVILDEVCTAGTATLKAIEVVEAEGCTVIGVISLVDREQGGSEMLKKKYNYRAIFTARELMENYEPAAKASQP